MLSGGGVKLLMDGMGDQEMRHRLPAPDAEAEPAPAQPGLVARTVARLSARLAPRPEPLDAALRRLGTTSPHLLADIGIRATAEQDESRALRVVMVSADDADHADRPVTARPVAAAARLAAE